MNNNLHSSMTFSDTIAGYVVSFDKEEDILTLRLADGRMLQTYLVENTFASIIYNFGEPYNDATGLMRDMLVPGRFLFAYAIFYFHNRKQSIEIKQIIFAGSSADEYVFEHPEWWIRQAGAIADFYLHAQFPTGTYDWRKYRTKLTLSGSHTSDYLSQDFRQETDTISRLIYGFATAYLLTGEERFLQAAESGVEYLREHMRVSHETEQIVWWYHAIDVLDNVERKVYASSFGDDYDAIPVYEQIYALAGLMQTYRINGDPAILHDFEKTFNLFQRFYRDEELGGYFSHLDPVTLDPRSTSLGQNRARKNWNSVGDHAPAYLINATLATQRKELEDFLITTGNLIVEHFANDDGSPFVQERFYEDWKADRHWGWQQNNAVVGHNLKIAWNLMRMHHRRPHEIYTQTACKLAADMAQVGRDQQRGGWYDVLERTVRPGHTHHRFVWHDRKAWWQQEQAILAYLILYGSLGDPEHLRLARESAAFYNAFFLDHDDGGIYFNVLANGIPYLVGNERLKGSHSMSGYHSMELCYLAAVYTNLLITEEPLDLYFKPRHGALPNNILHVAPDMLPPQSIRLTDVWINGEPYFDFDAMALTVRLPSQTKDIKVHVRIAPHSPKFAYQIETRDDVIHVHFQGTLEVDQLAKLGRCLLQIEHAMPGRIMLVLSDLETMSHEAMNALLLVCGKLSIDNPLTVVGANQQITAMLQAANSSFQFLDEEPTPVSSQVSMRERS